MREKLEIMLAEEQATIQVQLLQVTRDPPLVRAEIRAELLREILTQLPGKRPDWVEPEIDYGVIK